MFFNALPKAVWPIVLVHCGCFLFLHQLERGLFTPFLRSMVVCHRGDVASSSKGDDGNDVDTENGTIKGKRKARKKRESDDVDEKEGTKSSGKKHDDEKEGANDEDIEDTSSGIFGKYLWTYPIGPNGLISGEYSVELEITKLAIL